ncbi:hypothetical protein Tco_1303628 [Tanacetum coccineum]
MQCRRVLVRERSDCQVLERKKVNEELRKVRWPNEGSTSELFTNSVEVFRYDTKEKKLKNGKSARPRWSYNLRNKTQQGTSYEVSVSAEGVEELKRKVKIKGEKKEALLTLRQKPERFYTSAGNPVKEILLKLNLPDHRILKDVCEGVSIQRKDYEMMSVVRAAMRIFVDSRRMSTPVFVDPEISTQADKAQSSRVPVPLPEDPYEAIRQAYLDGTDTEFEHFKDPVKTETLESPLTVAPPTSLPESTSSTLVPILRRTARMVVCVPPAMSSGLSASMAEVAAMSEYAIRKSFRSSHESSPSLSPLDLPSRTRYQGTSELVEDSEEDDDEEGEEIGESLDSDSVSEDAEDEGPTVEDKDPTAGDEGLVAGDEGPGMGVESWGSDDESRGLDDEGPSVESDGLSLGEEEEAVPEGQHTFELGQGSGSAPESKRPERVSASRQPTLTTWTDPEDDMVYIDVPAYPPLAPPVQTPLSPE